MSKISKLSIKLSIPDKKEYEKTKKQFIANYKEYVRGSFLTGDTMQNKPDVGKAKWEALYPDGFRDWQATQGHKLTSHGEQVLIDKINEIIDAFNKLPKESS